MSRRSAVLLGLLMSIALAALTRTTWATSTASDLAGTTRDLTIQGGDASPTVTALALVGIAASLATSLSSAWIRLVTGPVMILVGLGAAASALLAWSDPLTASRSAISEAVGVVGGSAAAQTTSWPLAVLLPAALLAVLGVLVLRSGGRWARSSRYDRASRAAVPAAAVFDPAADPAGAWDALTLGEDPSAADEDADDEDADPEDADLEHEAEAAPSEVAPDAAEGDREPAPADRDETSDETSPPRS